MSSEKPDAGQKKPPIPPPAKKDPAINISLRGERLYQINNLNKWFAISSLLLFVFTVWMIMFDYNREWKRYQRQFNRLNIQFTENEMTSVAGAIDPAELDALNAQLAQAESELQQNQAEVNQIEEHIEDLNAALYAADQRSRFSRATYDVERYEYDEARASNAGNAAALGERADETLGRIREYDLEVDRLTLDIRAAEEELSAYVGQRDTIRSEIDALLDDLTQLRATLNTLDPGFVVTSIRNAPVLDFMNPSEQINQILLPNLHNEHPFLQVPRVDRCTTCHLGIDQLAMVEMPQPFTTHSELEKFVAADSPHPMTEFGCTTCHAGLDRAVEFSRAGHTPVDTGQREEWESQYGWEEQHFLETPMLPLDRIEASCLKCHTGAGDVPEAPDLNMGRDLVRTYGCFGCHRIPGYEDVRRVGPDLTTIASKLDRDWVRKWLREPRALKSEARMPQFWFNTNNSGPEYEARNVAEITAVTEFLFSKSQPNPLPPARTNGNPERGLQLVETVGCLACHAVGPIEQDPERTQHRRRFGYNLSGQGSKVSIEWLYNWVRDPRQVWHDTNMPNMRLTPAEAADVAAYLASLTNPDFEAQTFPEAEEAAIDEITLEFLRAGSTGIEAGEALATMSLEDKTLYSGERLISRYGCFGCHTIEGFEDTQPIGTELTEAGSKLLPRLDFGFLDIEHTRSAWYEQKLTDPRIFDVGRVKRPEELLRMPNFHFDEDQVDAIVLVLTGLVKDEVIPDMRNNLTEDIEAGRALIARRNCRGCHDIENAGGDIRSTIEDQGLWPPLLATQGAKTQPTWLHTFLQNPGQETLRPWLNTRMPTFYLDEVEATTSARYFSALDAVDFPFIDTSIATTNESLAVGRELFAAMDCALCHPVGSQIPTRDPADLAPDLGLAFERLRPQWILDWIRDPQAIAPGTRMPGFFFQGGVDTPFTNVLDGDAEAQIRAVRDHISLTLGDGTRSESTDD